MTEPIHYIDNDTADQANGRKHPGRQADWHKKLGDPEMPGDIHESGRKVLDLVSMMGETLLANGAEIARVQDTMLIVGRAFDKADIDVFAISNGIFVTLHHEDKTRCTQIKHVPLKTPNLGRVAQMNQLSREICEGKYTLDEAMEEMKQIAASPGAGLLQQVLACAVGSGCFCYLFGGSVWDCLAVAPVGVLLCLFQYAMGRGKISKVMQTILGSALITLGGMVMAALFAGLNMDKMIIGGLIILVPGVPLTTSIRDFFNGDYLSGAIRLIDAILVAVCMAIGVGVIYRLFY